MDTSEYPVRIYPFLEGAHCEILGFGVTGKALLPWLLSHGVASVTVRDKRSIEQMTASGDAQLITSQGAKLICGEAYLEGLGELPYTLIFRSPGIRPDIPEIQCAIERGAILTSEMELFLILTSAYVIAVTGSDGKTTTTTLISEMLKRQADIVGGTRVYLGGNIGTPLIPFVDDMTERDIVVVELSSFQLMTMPPNAHIHIAVITNITPNHLNWHIDYDEYIAAKTRICQSYGIERVVLNRGNQLTYDIGKQLKLVQVVYFSAKDASELPQVLDISPCVTLDGQEIVWQDAKGTDPMLKTSQIHIPGVHNVENYMAAMGAVKGMVDPAVMAEVAETFGGVPHRLQLVRDAGGIKFYNSSIDSTPTRTCAALSALKDMRERRGEGRPPIVICGGQDKHVPFDDLAVGLCEMASAVVITGEAKDQILDALKACPLYDAEKLTTVVIPDYIAAMKEACHMAKEGDVVLLSPACTSFDAFKNYVERGKAFVQIVLELPL